MEKQEEAKAWACSRKITVETLRIRPLRLRVDKWINRSVLMEHTHSMLSSCIISMKCLFISY